MKFKFCMFVILPFMAFTTLCSCSSGPPKCDDKEVIKKVIDLSKIEMLETTFDHYVNGHLKVNHANIDFGTVMTCKDGKGEFHIPYRDKAADLYNNMKIRLDNIRTDKIDKDVSKSTCKTTAEYDQEKIKLDLIYTVTNLPEGKLFVELSNVYDPTVTFQRKRSN